MINMDIEAWGVVLTPWIIPAFAAVVIGSAAFFLYGLFYYKRLFRTLKRGNVFICFFDRRAKRFSYLLKRKKSLSFRELKFKTFDEFLDQFQGAEQEGIRLAFASLSRESVPINLTLTSKRGQKTYRLTAHSFRANKRWAVVMLHDISQLEAEKSALRLECRMLTTSMTYYKGAFDQLPWPVWIRRGHELLYCNPTCARLLGVDKFEGGMLTAAFIDREFLTSVQPKAMIHEGARCLYHFHEKPFEGEVTMGYGEDLTKVYEQEKRLQSHLAFYREVLETLSAGVSIYDADQHMRYYNHAYARMFDFDEAFLCTNPHLTEVLDDLRSRRQLMETSDYSAYKRELISKHQNLHKPVESLNHLPDGRTMRMITSPHPMGGSFYIFEDITDRLNLEAKYNTQLAVYNATLDNLAEGVAVFGSDNRLQFSNKAFENIWNLPPGAMKKGEHLSVLSENGRHLIAPDQKWEDYRDRVMQLVTDRRPKNRIIHRLDGSSIRFSYTPLPDGSNFMCYQDVTDQLNLKQAYEEKKIAQQNADRLKSDFISSMSYEMRTPLNAIIGYSQLLSEEYAGELNPQQKGYCGDILTSSKRLLSLVNNILDLAMVESGHMTLKLEKFSLWPMLQAVVADFQGDADAVPIDSVSYPAEDFMLKGDQKHLRQSIEILLLQVSADIDPEKTMRFVCEQDENNAKIKMHIPLLESAYLKSTALLKQDVQKSPEGHKGVGLKNKDVALGISLSSYLIKAHGGTLTQQITDGGEMVYVMSLPSRPRVPSGVSLEKESPAPAKVQAAS